MNKQLILDSILSHYSAITNYQLIENITIIDLENNWIEYTIFKKAITRKVIKNLIDATGDDIEVYFNYKENKLIINYQFYKEQATSGEYFDKQLILKGYDNIKFIGLLCNYMKKEGV